MSGDEISAQPPGDQVVLRLDVLERLERQHEVEALVAELQPGRVALAETRVRQQPVSQARMADRFGADVDAGHRSGDWRDDRRAVALAAGDVEHALARGDLARECVAMYVFVPDLAHAFGRESFSGER